MLLELQNAEHKELIESMLLRHVPNCIEILNIQQLTGGASRQMFIAKVKTKEGDLHLVLRRLSGGEDSDNDMVEQLSLPQEVIVMKAALEAGIATPKVYFQFQEEDGIGEGYAMQFVAGETLGGRIAKSKKFVGARKKLTAQLAVALANIHKIDIEKTSLYKHLPAFTSNSAIERTYKVYQASNIDVPMLDYAVFWLRENMPSSVQPTLTHGDFRNGNFLVDKEDGLVSILDWELSAIGDPMRDLAWVCLNPWRYGVSNLPLGGFGTTEELFKIYEAEIGKPVDRPRFKFWQVYGCFWWSVACIMMGLSYRVFEGKLADRIAIGRRHSEGLIDIVNLIMPGPIKLNTPFANTQSREVATLSELILSTQKDFVNHVAPKVEGKALFVTRVAASNLGIALRETEQGSLRDEAEIKSTNQLLNTNYQTILDCRRALCTEIKKKNWSFPKDALKSHLRNCVARQIAIDQPTYSGLKDALDFH